MLMPTIRLYDGYDGNEIMRSAVEKLQWALRIHPDGLFGRDTLKAVLEFQKENDLEDDGIVGPITWATIQGETPPEFGVAATDIPDHVMDTYNVFKGKYFSMVVRVLEDTKSTMPLPIIFGIGYRESHWGDALNVDFTGDCTERRPRTLETENGPLYRGFLPPDGKCYGRGIMQIDYDWHEFARSGPWHIAESNIRYALGLLDGLVEKFSEVDASDRAKLRMTLASYNCGSGNVRRALRNGYNIDHYTAHRNYSENVIELAGYFEYLSSNRPK